jgi:hypothetical protein
VRKSLGVLGLALVLAAGAGGSGHANAAPSATRWVGTHGIEVAVPARWQLGRGMCGTPKAATVLWNEDGILACLTGQPPGLSVVEFGGVERGGHESRGTPVTIDGAAALRRSAGTVAGSRQVQLVFPRRGITVSVLSPDRALLQRILGSVRTVRVDENGCPTRPAPDYRRGSRPSGPFVPRGAVRMIGCSYHGRWLDQSNRIGPHAAANLTRALDAAPSGFSHAPRGSILASSCAPSWHGSLIVATFEYEGRRPVTISAHLDGCTRLGASNGRWAIRLRAPWVDRIVGDAHYAGGFLQYGA